MSPSMRIGIDLGGTKIEAVAVDAHNNILARERTATPAGDYHGTITQIRELIAALESKLDQFAKVGVGMPGAISPQTGLVKNANSTWLNGKPFDIDLEAATGKPLRFANDANCFALSEAVDGAAQNANCVFGIILGTGVGGGLVINQTVLGGQHAITGEWGHCSLPWPRDDERPGPPCYCGASGCIETFLSGPGLSASFERDTQNTLSAEEIVARAEAGDPSALACIETYENRLARALAMVINMLDPDVIVVGGGLSNIDRLYENTFRLLQAYVFSDACHTPVVKNRHGDSSGVRGAAWLWPAEEVSP